MELVTLVERIESGLSLVESSVVTKTLGAVVRGWASLVSDEALLSSKDMWLHFYKQNIFKGRSDLLLVIKEVALDAKGQLSSDRSESISHLYERVYNHSEFNSDAMYYMAFASRFDGLYFGFDYLDHRRVVGLEQLSPINKQWYYDAAKYIARVIYADLSA